MQTLCPSCYTRQLRRKARARYTIGLIGRAFLFGTLILTVPVIGTVSAATGYLLTLSDSDQAIALDHMRATIATYCPRVPGCTLD